MKNLKTMPPHPLHQPKNLLQRVRAPLPECTVIRGQEHAEDITAAIVPKKEALTAAEVEELLKPSEFSWADEDFEDTPIVSTEEVHKVTGCNGGNTWCPTRQQLSKSGLVADNGFTLHGQMEDTDVGGPLYVCPQRLLCLYRPKQFQQEKLFVSFTSAWLKVE